MATQHGFGASVSSGLTFAYDTIDTVNSYLGEPTTNLINPNTVNIYSWWNRTVQTITQLSETYNGQPIYRVSLSIDDGDMLYHIRERWGAGSGWYMPYVIFNLNTPYIASVIYRPVSHPDTLVYGHPSNIGGWGRSVDGSIDLDSGWKKHRIDRNHAATVGDNRFYHMHTPSAEIGQTVTVDITHSQIEQKDHATQFTPTSRSATQGLLPLAGTSTLNLSNVSFDANAQMVFDGTADTIPIGTVGGYSSNITCESVFRTTSGASWKNMISGGCGDILFTVNGNLLNFGAQCSSPIPHANYSNTIVNTGAWFHAVATYNGSLVKIYINGVLENTYTRSGSFTPGVLRVGSSSSGASEFFQGELPLLKVYNRELTAAEVTQNFKKYQTRFGLV